MKDQEYEDLMQEPPFGPNHGRSDGAVPLGQREQQAREMLGVEGFTVVGPDVPFERGGVTGQRAGNPNPFTSDLDVDEDVLRGVVEETLGFTVEEINAVYPKTAGGLTATQRALRANIDARLLAVSRSGGNMLLLARVLGWTINTVNDKSTCSMMYRALRRARQEHVEPQVKNPAVRSKYACFVCGEAARPRKRRHKTCPQSVMPLPVYRDNTISLCDSHYAQGFDTRPGSPAYWASRHGSPVTKDDHDRSMARMRELLAVGR